MKKIIVIVGPNGVGKSTTAKALVQRCPGSALVEGDWFCAVNPFPPTDHVRQTVEESLYDLFRNDLRCKDIDIVIFPYALHGGRRETFQRIVDRLGRDGLQFQVHMVVLKCAYEENLRRARLDGREEHRIARGMRNTFHFYDALDCPIVDTTGMQPAAAAEKIVELFGLR